MSFTNQKLIPSGTYMIINVKHGCSVTCRKDQVLQSSSNGYNWTITQLANKKWIIQSHSGGLSAHLGPDPEEGGKIRAQESQGEPHQWVIKRCTESQDSYIIYSPKQIGLFWSLPSTKDGTAVQLARDSGNNSSWWRFRQTETAGTVDGEECNPSPLSVARPTSHSPIVSNTIAITIPPGWGTVITGVSIGECINLVRVNRTVEGVVETEDFISSWDSIDEAMILSGSGMNSYAIPAIDEPAVVVLKFFHSKDIRQHDPRRLPSQKDLSTNLRINSLARPGDMRNLPDYETFWIFDEEPGVGSKSNAIFIVQSHSKVSVDLNYPDKPAPGTVNEGYHENMDKPRPSYLDEYLENFNVIFVIDDSGSMSGEKWSRVRSALAQIGNEAMQYDADGIDICFLNSPVHKKSIMTQRDIFKVFDQVQPQGRTPMGAKLQAILEGVVDRLDDAIDTPAYGQIKPVDIVVITDGVPTDDPASVIQAAAVRLTEGMHHLNAVGIQFVQIGKDEGADQALMQLCKSPVRGMVDTVPYAETFTSDRLKRILLGGLHPSIRAKL